APAGRAIAQSPRPGTRVSDGSTVRVTLSGGPAPVSVPRLVGAWSRDAEAILGGLKLRANVSDVPALGAKVDAVTKQSPAAGAPLTPGSAVRIWVAQPPQLRGLTTLTSDGSGTSVPFRIRGRRWQIDYAMSYDGTCALVFVCQGPTATVTDLSTGATVDQFDLSDGGEQNRIVHSGPDIYQVSVSPGSDTTTWKIHVLDYY
ncbi:MAG TPA: PASTA domain-containing protein, partial [Mycobacteriales bacterium]|nr:PASTA domain-containing protein [Mycobacteriales bacterium]